MKRFGFSATGLGGSEVPRLRDYEITINSTLTLPIASGVHGFVSASYQTAHGGFQSPANSDPYPGYSQLDGRIGVRLRNLTASVFARNITDQVYIVNSLNGGDFYSEPRVVGAELRLKF